jgi:hypothetical protein
MITITILWRWESIDFSGTYLQQDQMARPAINTVLLLQGSLKTILMQLFLCNGEQNTSLFLNLDF